MVRSSAILFTSLYEGTLEPFILYEAQIYVKLMKNVKLLSLVSGEILVIFYGLGEGAAELNLMVDLLTR